MFFCYGVVCIVGVLEILDFRGVLFCAWLMHVLLFFKQKTAYEMRISDWSSDVCSSDLVPDMTLSPLKVHQRTPRNVSSTVCRRTDAGEIDMPGSLLTLPSSIRENPARSAAARPRLRRSTLLRRRRAGRSTALRPSPRSCDRKSVV